MIQHVKPGRQRASTLNYSMSNVSVDITRFLLRPEVSARCARPLPLSFLYNLAVHGILLIDVPSSSWLDHQRKGQVWMLLCNFFGKQPSSPWRPPRFEV